MNITVNGEEKKLEKGLTVAVLIGKYKLKKDAVAVEVNQKIVKKADYKNSILKDRDKVEIVHFVGGG